MKEFQYTVKDACGIHARPAGLLVKTVKGFASTATLEKDGKSCDMRKLMALMGMGVKQGETVTYHVMAKGLNALTDGPVTLTFYPDLQYPEFNANWELAAEVLEPDLSDPATT